MDWLRAAEHLRRRREPGVLVTVLEVRGHAPRDAGSRMVVAAEEAWGSIGGGNLEATAVDRAREMLAAGRTGPEQLDVALTPHTHGHHGDQCCGGQVALALEPLPVLPAVAVFGVGHVGLELARILARQDIDLHLVDSRADRLAPEVLAPLADAVARVHSHHGPDPAALVEDLPVGTHVLVLTHDHAQDVAVCDAALRHPELGSIGLIGSSAKWRRFEVRLAEQGHPAAEIGRIRTPIGLPQVAGKDPATIAVSVAAELLAIMAAPLVAPIRPDRSRRGSGPPRGVGHGAPPAVAP
jgi:xanthine dehydrogenase accessory factor